MIGSPSPMYACRWESTVFLMLRHVRPNKTKSCKNRRKTKTGARDTKTGNEMCCFLINQSSGARHLQIKMKCSECRVRDCRGIESKSCANAPTAQMPEERGRKESREFGGLAPNAQAAVFSSLGEVRRN